MDVASLGGSGVEVTRLILGCGNFGGVGSAPAFFGHGVDRAEAMRLMDAAWDAGIRAFDTADAYGGGASERFIGEWLASKPSAVADGLVITSKTFNPMDEGHDSGLAPERIRRQVDASLARLGVERITLYMAHEFDPAVPQTETLGAFGELIDDGKIGAVGASNFSTEQLAEALAASDEHGLAGYQWVQNSFSLLDRSDAATVLALCATRGLGYTPFGPLAGGWLTGKYRRNEPPPPGSRMTLRPEPYLAYRTDRVYDALDTLADVAADHHTSMGAIAVAWLLAHPGISAVVIGPNRLNHLWPMLDAPRVAMGPELFRRLSEVFG